MFYPPQDRRSNRIEVATSLAVWALDSSNKTEHQEVQLLRSPCLLYM